MTTTQHRRRPTRVQRRRRFVALLLAGLAVVIIAGLVIAGILSSAAETPDEPTADVPPTASASATPSAPPAPPPVVEPPSFDTTTHSIDDANSIWVVGDKLRPLQPLNYVPGDLVTANVPGTAPMRAEAATAMEAMFIAASAEASINLSVQNAYRSYDTQVSLHQRHVTQLGQERARAQSAMPGYSEHQTGLSADIMAANGVCTIQECFATTPEGIWLAENAWRFGYHLRYPAGKTDVTGYIFEPWHYRYVGVELATELRDTGVVTLEEFFGLPAAPAYPPGV